MPLQPLLTALSSGLELLRIPMPATPSVTALLLGNTGSRYEQPKEQGIAHFFEHMVFKGTAKYPEAQALAVTIDAIGAQSNAFTSKEYTGYYIKAASRHVPLALDVLTDMLVCPLLKQEDIDRERGVIIEEINMYEDTPMQNIGNVFEQLLYAGSGLEHDVIGRKQTVGEVQRADFVSFLQTYYHPANLTLVVAGDAAVVGQDALAKDLDQLLQHKLTQATIGAIEKNQRLSAATLIPSPAGFGKHRLVVQQKPTEQVHLILGWPGMKRSDPRRYGLTILTTVLGGNMSSRLFTEVREKRGLCYYVHSDVDFYHDTGSVMAGAGVDPKRVHEAMTVIADECQQLGSGSKKVTAEELNRAKEYTIGSLQLSLENSSNVAQFFGMKQLLMRQMESPEEVIEHLRKVTLEEVTDIAEELLVPTQSRLAVIGPLGQDEFEKYVT